MPEKINIKLNPAEVKKLLKGQGPYKGVRTDLEARMNRIAAAAGPGHSAEIDETPNRLRAGIWTSTDEARKAEATNLNLTRAIDAGRGS